MDVQEYNFAIMEIMNMATEFTTRTINSPLQKLGINTVT
jgi:hypothetical protein